MKTYPALLFAAILSLSSVTLHSTVIFESDFNNYSQGALPTSYSNGPWTTATNNDARKLYSQVITDAGNVFGKGPDNKYLSLRDELNTTSDYAFVTAGKFTAGVETGTLSFDLYSPTVAGAQGDGFILRIGQIDPGNNTTAFALVFNNGNVFVASGGSVTPSTTALAAYSLDAVHAVSVVFNNSESPIAYNGNTLESRKADLWIDGVRYTFDPTGNVSRGVALTGFNFTEKITGNPATDFVGALYLDNLIAYDTAVIPEPGNVVLGSGLVVLLLAVYSARFRK